MLQLRTNYSYPIDNKQLDNCVANCTRIEIMTCCFLECSLVFPSREEGLLEKDPSDEESLLSYENDEEYRKYKCTLSWARFLAVLRKFRRWIYTKWTSKGCRKCRSVTCISILSLLLILFLVFFVALPLAFENSIVLQRSLIFHPVTAPHDLYESSVQHAFYSGSYYNQKPNITNRYVIISKTKNLQLGVWNVSHSRQYDRYSRHSQWNSPNDTQVLLCFHREIGDRRAFLEGYYHLAEYFDVIAFDYRSYGDSSVMELNEEGLVDDSIRLYKWLRNQTKGDIFVWGDTLGAAIASHTIARLRNENIIPAGLILETPFVNLADNIKEWYWPLGKVFSWMPWYDALITSSLEENDLSFKTTEYILNVDCPILILRTWQDRYSTFAEKLKNIAKDRDPLKQGSITTSMWWSSSYEGNIDSSVTNDFISDCRLFQKNKEKAA